MSRLHDSLALMKEHAKRADARYAVLNDIKQERSRQESKWGDQHWPHQSGSVKRWETAREKAKAATDAAYKAGTLTWQDILWEEICEAFAETDWQKRRAELVQIAAVVVAEIEDGDLATS